MNYDTICWLVYLFGLDVVDVVDEHGRMTGTVGNNSLVCKFNSACML